MQIGTCTCSEVVYFQSSTFLLDFFAVSGPHRSRHSYERAEIMLSTGAAFLCSCFHSTLILKLTCNNCLQMLQRVLTTFSCFCMYLWTVYCIMCFIVIMSCNDNVIKDFIVFLSGLLLASGRDA